MSTQTTDPTSTTTMQAVVHDAYGTADVLRLTTMPRPRISDGDVLVQVRAERVHVIAG